ncbi:MAG: CHAT domain-containing protein [Prochloraceae cyanobacterium]
MKSNQKLVKLRQAIEINMFEDILRLKLPFKKSINYLIFLILLLCFLLGENVTAKEKIATETTGIRAEELYNRGEYDRAIELLKQLATDASENRNFFKQILVRRNLILIYLKQGNLQKAETAIAAANSDLAKINNIKNRQKAETKILEVSGQLQFDRGNFELALNLWQKADKNYQKNEVNYFKNQINIVRALQNLGLYARALKIATKIEQNLAKKPNDSFKHQTLLTLGSLLQGTGKLLESQTILQQSLTVAEQLNSPEAIAQSLLSLGNTARLQGELIEAFELYQKAIAISKDTQTKIESKLNQLNLLITTRQIATAKKIIPQIETQLNLIPASHDTIFARINLAQNYLEIEELERSKINLKIAIARAEELENKRGLSYAWGTLGKVYESEKNLAAAKKSSEKALYIAAAINAPEIAYQWQWQLGRIYKQKQDRDRAIKAYSQAIENLKFLRRDLIVNSSQIRFNFRESVEPVYRELADLLLRSGATQADLQLARKTIEALQLAELDNFFRNACLDARSVNIDRFDRNAAIFYTIILEDRLEIILALPDRPLTRYPTKVTRSQIENTSEELRMALSDPNDDNYRKIAKVVHDWTIAPLKSQLAANEVQNLVFVMDGALRNIPVAALFDGENYLIEQYAIAYAPTLQLIDDRTSKQIRERVLLAGLSEARQDFPALPGVKQELNTIETKIAARVLLNNDFTETNFATALERSPFSIVHIASHGEFSSQLEDTYILTWNERINIDELNLLLRSDSKQTNPIELLILSACQTAVGDKQAAIGLAGMAVRAGARSTIASLWAVSDESTTILMTDFYAEWTGNDLTKAEALRRAQLGILQQEKFSHPYFWSAFILLGNWL